MNIDTKLVAAMIADQFPQWARLPVRQVLPGGWDNRTFRLGEDMLIRIPSAAPYAAKVEMEQKWLPLLAPQLSLDIPCPLAMGQPSDMYPWHWSVYGWIPGAALADIEGVDRANLSKGLAAFLLSLQAIDAAGGPLAGEHNFYRGGSLSVYDKQAREAIRILKDKLNTGVVMDFWHAAVKSTWQRPPVWVHGDVSAGNLLVRDGVLSAVIDFGGLCVGDPACDYVMAWTYMNEEDRIAFKGLMNVDEDAWVRGCAWALWKAMIIESGLVDSNELEKSQSSSTLKNILLHLGGA